MLSANLVLILPSGFLKTKFSESGEIAEMSRPLHLSSIPSKAFSQTDVKVIMSLMSLEGLMVTKNRFENLKGLVYR